jgi:hypothetical protein
MIFGFWGRSFRFNVALVIWEKKDEKNPKVSSVNSED